MGPLIALNANSVKQKSYFAGVFNFPVIPIFPRINFAIRYTIEYYKIGRIREEMLRFAGGLNCDYLDTLRETTVTFHQYMEDEITQNIHGSNHNIQVAMFEYLKEFLGFWGFQNNYKDGIQILIAQYNEKTYNEFQSDVEDRTERFKETVDFSKPNSATWEIETGIRYNLLPLGIFSHGKTKETIINRWFYCIEEKPDLIDTAYLPKYFDLLDRISTSFLNIVGKYVALYDAGKILSSADIIIEKQVLSEGKETKLLAITEPQLPKKLKVNLSVPQLAYLFKLLFDFGFIETVHISDQRVPVIPDQRGPVKGCRKTQG